MSGMTQENGRTGQGQLHGKVAVVTGSAQGLGLAISQRFVEEGATVVISDLDQQRAESAAKLVGAAGAVSCDVRSEDRVKQLVDHTVAE